MVSICSFNFGPGMLLGEVAGAAATSSIAVEVYRTAFPSRRGRLVFLGTASTQNSRPSPPLCRPHSVVPSPLYYGVENIQVF